MNFRNTSKVLLSAASIMTMMASVAPVVAEEKTTQINYTVTEAYTWEAPAAITFESNTDTKPGTLSVTKNVIGYGKKLQIKIDSAEDFKLVDSADSNNFRTYKIKNGDSVLGAGDVVLEVNAGTNEGSAALTFALDGVTVEKAGSYAGVANFVSSIEAQ